MRKHIDKRMVLTERDFLLQILKAFLANKEAPKPPDALDWDLFDRLVHRNGLEPISRRMLDVDTIAQQRRLKWDRRVMQTLFWNNRALRETANLFRLFDDHGIRAAAMRGIALAQRVYHDISLRPMRDVDILIRKSDRDAVFSCLASRGIHPTMTLRSQFVFSVNNVIFEIHWRYLTPKRYRNCADYEKWVDHRISADSPFGKIYCLHDTEEFAGLVMHAFIHHEMSSLLSMVDIALLSANEAIDWPRLVSWCNNARVSRIFVFALSYIDYLLTPYFTPHIKDFAAELPHNARRAFEAHSALAFANDSYSAAMCRMKNAVFVAEGWPRAFRQILRLFSTDTFIALFRFASKRRNSNAKSERNGGI